MKKAIEQLKDAIETSKAIYNHINNGNHYYTTTTSTTKNQTTVLLFNGHPTRGTRQETNFNAALANESINNSAAVINSALSNANNQFDIFKAQTDQQVANNDQLTANINQQNQNLRTSLNAVTARHNQLISENNNLTKQIQEKKYQVQNKISQIKRTEDDIISIGRDIEINKEIHQNSQVTIEFSRQRASTNLNELEKNLNSIKANQQKLVKNWTAQQRTKILINIWQRKDEDSQNFIKILTKLDLDLHYTDNKGNNLIKIAMENNDLKLLNLILDLEPDYNLELGSINGKTYLQHAIANNYDVLAQRMLSTEIIFSQTLLYCIKQNDISTIEKLLHTDINLTRLTIHGHPLVQLAVISNKIEITEKILSINPGTIDDRNFKDQSVLQIALKLKNAAMIKIIANHIDIQKEFKALVAQDQVDELETLLEALPNLIDELPISTFIQIIQDNKFEMAKMLINQGIHVDEAMGSALNQNNKDFLHNLVFIDKECIVETHLTKSDLISKARELEEYEFAQILEQKILIEISGNAGLENTVI